MALGAKVGNAYISIDADFSPLQRSLQRIGTRLNLPAVDIDGNTKPFDGVMAKLGEKVRRAGADVGIGADTTAFTKTLSALDGEVTRKRLPGLTVDADTSAFDRALSTLDAKISTKRFAGLNLTADTTAFDRSLAAVDEEVRRHNVPDLDVDVHADTTGFRSEIESASRSVGGLSVTIDAIRPAAMITALGGAAQAASALAAGAIAAGAALAPLGGLVAAYATAYSAVGQGMGVVKLAVSGVSEVLTLADGDAKKFKAALAELPAPAQAFALELVSLKPKLEELRTTAAAGLLPGATEGLKAATDSFAPLKAVVETTGTALGDLARQVGELVGSKAWGSDIRTIGESNSRVITSLGTAAINSVDAMRNVVAAAGPLTEWLAKVAEGWSATIREQTQAARDSGKLTEFFEKTKAVTQQLGSILGSLGTAFKNVATAAAPLGGSILTAIEKASSSFATWTASAEGKNAIAEFFTNAKAPIFELGRLIHDITNTFFRLGNGDQVAPLLEALRTKLLPVLESVVSSTTAAFGPALIDMLAQVGRLFGVFAGTSGPLTAYVNILGTFAGALATLLEKVPGLSTLVVTLAGLMTVMKAAQFGAALTGVTALAGAYTALGSGATFATVAQERGIVVTTATAAAQRVAAAATTVWAAVTSGQAGLLSAVTLATVRQRVAMIAGAAATGVLAAAQGALNLVLSANPIVLIVAGLAALVAGFILAYKHSETFRDIVDSVWAAIKTGIGAAISAIGSALTWLKGIAGPVLDFIGKAASTGLLGPIPLIIARWGDVKDFLAAAFNAIKDTATTVFNALAPIVTGAFTVISRAVSAAMDVIGTVISTGWTVIKTVFTTAMSVIGPVVSTAFDTMKTVVGAALSVIGAAISTAWSTIKTITSTMWSLISGAISAAWEGVKTVVGAAVGAIGSALGTAWSGIKAGATLAWELIRTAIVTPITAVVTWGKTQFENFKVGLGVIWGAIKTAATTAWAAIKSAIVDPVTEAWTWVKDKLELMKIGAGVIWRDIKSAASDAWLKVKGFIVDPIRDAVEWVGTKLGTFKTDLKDAWDKIIENIGTFATNVKEKITSAFKDAANGVIGFVNAITSAINKIPGIPDIPAIPKLATGGVYGTQYGAAYNGGVLGPEGLSKAIPGYAVGGVARHNPRGGHVTRPLMVIGEEAPKHDEYVIPTNPAYRSRALALHAAVGKQLNLPGYKIGGIFGNGIEVVKNTINTAKDLADTGWDLITDGPAALIKLLPGVDGMLPWLKDTGRYALKMVTDWIEGRVKALLSIGGGKGLNAMIAFANKLDAMKIPYGPQGHAGWAINRAGEDCSSTVSKVLHAGGFLDTVATTVTLPSGRGIQPGAGRQVTMHDRTLAGDFGHVIIQLGNRYFGTSGFNYAGGPGWLPQPSAGYLASLPTKLHPQGLFTGGVFGNNTTDVLPFVGSYKNGGTVPKDGMAFVHRNETIIPGELPDREPVPLQVNVDVNDSRFADAIRVTVDERAKAHGKAAAQQLYAGSRRGR